MILDVKFFVKFFPENLAEVNRDGDGSQFQAWDCLFLNGIRRALPIRREQCMQKFSSQRCKHAAELWPTDLALENMWTCLDFTSPKSMGFTQQGTTNFTIFSVVYM